MVLSSRRERMTQEQNKKVPEAVWLAPLTLAIAIAFTKFNESGNKEYLMPYIGEDGVPTVCDGLTAGAGVKVVMGEKWTREQCAIEGKRVQTKIAITLSQCVHVPVTHNQAAALIDMGHNIGEYRLCGSTLVSKLNMLDYQGAASAFSDWVYFRRNKKGPLEYSPGLATRRMRAMLLFITPDGIPLSETVMGFKVPVQPMPFSLMLQPSIVSNKESDGQR